MAHQLKKEHTGKFESRTRASNLATQHEPHDPHEHDSQNIHFVPWLNSLALQGEASGASSHHYHYHHHHHHRFNH
ncbi:hypothetical protein E2C01_068469 [Portunus trituberculatus]|uniref:Uncharacterized protein n=1 Tax=Portunus trituberculatus TaxID=210409 RepID=A0A5B7HNX1_PORTR|nr:hypothetical protein [Portunus trituberculatus]